MTGHWTRATIGQHRPRRGEGMFLRPVAASESVASVEMWQTAVPKVF
jgi:hypothetical protein